MAPARSYDADGRTTAAPHVGSRRTVLVALVANLAIAATKLVGFLLTGSTALLAETGHSLADTANQGLLLVGARVAAVGPSEQHPFGRGRERYFWAFVVGLLLFGLGGVVAVLEGVQRLAAGDHQVADVPLAVVLIVAAAMAESLSLRTAARDAGRSKPDDTSWLEFVRRSRDPEVTVVLVEDTGALAGLLVALAGVVASAATNDATWDAAATIVIGALLCVLAAFLTHEMHSLLVGEPLTDGDRDRVQQAVLDTPGIATLLNLRTEHIGPDEVLMCAKVALDEPVSYEQSIAIIDGVEDAVREVLPTVSVCYIELDRFDRNRVRGPEG